MARAPPLVARGWRSSRRTRRVPRAERLQIHGPGLSQPPRKSGSAHRVADGARELRGRRLAAEIARAHAAAVRLEQRALDAVRGVLLAEVAQHHDAALDDR